MNIFGYWAGWALTFTFMLADREKEDNVPNWKILLFSLVWPAILGAILAEMLGLLRKIAKEEQ